MVYFHKVLKEYTGRLNRPMNFIQIGCNDGVMADPISEYIIKEDWQGIFVDADSFYLQKAANYYANYCEGRIKSDRLRWYNSAVTPMKTFSSNTVEFYSIKPNMINPKPIVFQGSNAWQYGSLIVKVEGNPDVDKNNPLDYLRGIGSLDYDFVITHIANVVKKTDISGILSKQIFSEDSESYHEFVKTQSVRNSTINEIFNLSQMSHIDILQTDMECWDEKIICEIEDFLIKPKIIHFEVPGGIITNDTLNKLNKCGYSVSRTIDTRDTLAILQ